MLCFNTYTLYGHVFPNVTRASIMISSAAFFLRTYSTCCSVVISRINVVLQALRNECFYTRLRSRCLHHRKSICNLLPLFCLLGISSPGSDSGTLHPSTLRFMLVCVLTLTTYHYLYRRIHVVSCKHIVPIQNMYHTFRKNRVVRILPAVSAVDNVTRHMV